MMNNYIKSDWLTSDKVSELHDCNNIRLFAGDIVYILNPEFQLRPGAKCIGIVGYDSRSDNWVIGTLSEEAVSKIDINLDIKCINVYTLSQHLVDDRQIQRVRSVSLNVSRMHIMAIDFDNTLYLGDNFPKIDDNGTWNDHLIMHIKQWLYDYRFRLILWTCREGEELRYAINALASKGIYMDAYNDNLPEVVNAWNGSNPRKVFCHRLIDDTAQCIRIE